MTDVCASGWIVRQAAAADLRGLVALARRDSATETADSVAVRITGLLDDPARIIVVAESDDTLVGVAEAQFYGVAMRRGFGSGRLHDLFVEPSWRRRGIAGALSAEVKAWARALPQCRYLEWQSSPSGLAFYEAMHLVANEADNSDDYPFFEVEV